MSAAGFPLEPLRDVRGIRLRTLEAELKRSQQQHAQAEAQWHAAEATLAAARQRREDFAAASWQQLFEQGQPTGLALDRHERHLALLDQEIAARHEELIASEQALAEALKLLELASTAWRQARKKLDAVGELKLEWQRGVRRHEEWREEQNLEELLLRPTPNR